MKRSYQIYVILGAVLLCLLPFWYLFYLYLSIPDYIDSTNAFREQMQADVDIEAIRLWLKDLPEEAQCREHWLEKPEWPEPIRALKPRDVMVTTVDDHYVVFLFYGGGFGSWGLVVGPQTMPMPTSRLGPLDDYRVELEEGDYVFHELQ